MKRFQAVAGALVVAVTAGGAKPGEAENVLRWASATEALTFDPHSANNFPTIAANLQVYEPLVDFNSSSEIEPALAVAWQLIDPTTWQFDLRRDVRFHDGTPFTSADVVFSMQRGTSATSDFRSAVSPITAVEAVDDHTVRITTATPNPILPEQLNSIPMMSERWAGQHDALLPTAYGGKVDYAERHANGTGPFKLVRFEPGVGSVMAKNPEWWGLGQNPHNLDRIVHTVIKDSAPRLAALLGGEVDFLSDPPLADLDQIERTPGLKLARTNETRTIFLGLDQGSAQLRSSNITGKNPFADRRVRQAVYQAIDVQTIRDQVMSGLAIPIGMIIQPGIDQRLRARTRHETPLRPRCRQGTACGCRLPRRLRRDPGLPERSLHQRRGHLSGRRCDARRDRHPRQRGGAAHARASTHAQEQGDRLLHARLGYHDLRFALSLELCGPK
jgi:peptide/nickel transport system substrate-binding protein